MFEQVIDDERGWQRMVLVPRGARPEGVRPKGAAGLMTATLCCSLPLFATLYYSLLLLCYVYDESQELIAT